MSNKEILEKALKVLANAGVISKKFEVRYDAALMTIYNKDDRPLVFEPRSFFLTHEVAKALWGEELWSLDPTGWHKHKDADTKEEQAWYLEAWQYHIQQMVVSDNWIKYLGENI